MTWWGWAIVGVLSGLLLILGLLLYKATKFIVDLVEGFGRGF